MYLPQLLPPLVINGVPFNPSNEDLGCPRRKKRGEKDINSGGVGEEGPRGEENIDRGGVGDIFFNSRIVMNSQVMAYISLKVSFFFQGTLKWTEAVGDGCNNVVQTMLIGTLPEE